VVRTFAGLYPTETVGLILVDPAHETFYPRAALEYSDQWTLEDQAHFTEVFSDPERRAEQGELAGYLSSLEQARASDSLHSTPTVVLIAGRNAGGPPDPMMQIWIEELQIWAAARPRTEARVVDGAGHNIARDSPESVINGIRSLVQPQLDKQ
jgi:pimeloyl-ACP methyl ester carboxylesterase